MNRLMRRVLVGLTVITIIGVGVNQVAGNTQTSSSKTKTTKSSKRKSLNFDESKKNKAKDKDKAAQEQLQKDAGLAQTQEQRDALIDKIQQSGLTDEQKAKQIQDVKDCWAKADAKCAGKTSAAKAAKNTKKPEQESAANAEE